METLICIDRDGTLIYDDKYFLGKTNDWKKKIKFLPNVIKGLKLLNTLPNTHIYMISNQTGVAIKNFKLLTSKRADKVCEEVTKRLNSKGANIKGYIFCPHTNKHYVKTHPNRKFINKLVKDSSCRKPHAGMVYEALNKTNLNRKDVKIYVIGDRVADVQTGLNANGTGIMIPFQNEAQETEKLKKLKTTRGSRSKSKIYTATDFLDAANHILEKETNRRTIKAKKQILYDKATKIIETKIKSILKSKMSLKQEKQANISSKSQNKIKIASKQQKKAILGFVGGNTVIPLLKRLKQAKIAWKHVHIFMLDERIVPITSKQSNFKQINDILLKPLIKQNKLPVENIHPFIPQKNKANYGINSYSNKLKKLGGKIDLAILSAGEDGHIASLFPNKLSQARGNYFSIIKNSPKPPKQRMTITKNLLKQTNTAILLTIGKNKTKAKQDLANNTLTPNQSPQKLVLSIKESYILTD